MTERGGRTTGDVDVRGIRHARKGLFIRRVYTRAGIFYVIRGSNARGRTGNADNFPIVPKASIHGIRSLRQLRASCLLRSIVSFVFARGKLDILGDVKRERGRVCVCVCGTRRVGRGS